VLVYGDQQVTRSTLDVLADVHRQANALAEKPGGILWHQACVGLFVTAAGLVQGVADAEFAASGHDTLSAPQVSLMVSLRDIAGVIDLSWRSALARQDLPELSALALLDPATLPGTVTIRRCEGYAFYALYPEQYLMAAQALPPGSSVIGLRSIGTGLAALVASVCDADLVCTLRPVGDVYDRRLAVGADLEAAILARRDGVFVLVDEGPGQSGSSLGGTADYLEARGVARESIVFMPSHAGDLGPNARPDHRRRWNAATRLTAPFEHVLLGETAAAPLPTWFEDLTGAATAPLRDLSGGQWRELSPGQNAPADPGREARKYLLTTASGMYLLKFIGLDHEAAAKFARAERLHAAGFSPEPLGVRHGFLAQRWMPAMRASADTDIWPTIARYLTWRAAAFPAEHAGASLHTLVAMARYNVGQAAGRMADPLFDAWPADRLERLQSRVRPVHVDARMHRWEWIPSRSGLLKTDAIDHAHAHDLIGCQDVAWDVAGAIVEFSASDAERTSLIRDVLGERADAFDLTTLLTLCYLGFQIGWWDFSTEAQSAAGQRQFYLKKIEDLVQSS
jgi:hypothetical protein